MINIMLAGNKKVFDGALTELISITNRTKESIHCYLLTADVSRIKEDYVPIEDEQIEFLNEVIKTKNPDNIVEKMDVTELYEDKFKGSKNEMIYTTPYTLLRLLADYIPNLPDKLLYLDIDMMANGDIKELWDIDVSDVEYAAVKEKYGCWAIRPDYINAGMLLMNMKKISETKMLEKARKMLMENKLLFGDQDAIFWSTTKKKILPRKFNEQSKFDRKDTVICHFCKRLMFRPFPPHTTNFKQWNIEKVHSELKCFTFDDDLKEYSERIKEWEKRNTRK